MKLSDFDYRYPGELVAQHPLPERDASRMMLVSRNGGGHEHHTVRELPEFLRDGDVLVINTTRVLPVRLVGRKESGGSIEVLLLRRGNADTGDVRPGGKTWICHGAQQTHQNLRSGINLPFPHTCPAQQHPTLRDTTGNWRAAGPVSVLFWWCLTSHTRKSRPGMKITFSPELEATVIERQDEEVLLSFQCTNSFELSLNTIGLPPLPPYIVRKNLSDYSAGDRERYQTVFAQHTGSAAAPTAGLHLTEALLAKIRERGIQIAEIVLHVGRDTFQPVRTENIADHRMHGEEFTIPEETADIINTAKTEGRRVIAVGTTCVRALESACSGDTILNPGIRTTHVFITPGYAFRAIDGLLTNFHQPRSTLLMLVSAFLGHERTLALYRDAIWHRYRLFSFGDCMLAI